MIIMAENLLEECRLHAAEAEEQVRAQTQRIAELLDASGSQHVRGRLRAQAVDAVRSARERTRCVQEALEWIAGVELDRHRPIGDEEDLLLQSEALLRIRLIAPTAPAARVEAICAKAAGFIYYVSREGVTGAQASVVSSLGERIAEIRRFTKLPIAVGFGISNAEQAREVAQSADAIVVGSAIVQRIFEERAAADMPERIGAFVKALAAATKESAQR